ncbi:MAG: ATP-grasp domain-containing protein [bacterium]
MQTNPYSPSQWKHLIPDIDSVIQQIEKHNIIAVGITPFTRIIPGFFLKNFSIYAIKNSGDTDVLKKFMRMHVLEDRHPDLAKKVHGTGYLVSNYSFKAFLKSHKTPPTLKLNTISEKTANELEQMGIDWIGNHPRTFADVTYKSSFRELTRTLELSPLPTDTHSRDIFLTMNFKVLWANYEGPFVVQRGDKEVGGNEGTFFIHNAHDFESCLATLGKDTQFSSVVVSPFIEGYSTSMLGCVMQGGTLTGPLQLQLIDVPQALNGVSPNGIFFGNDLGFHPWSEEIEHEAQRIVEVLGLHMKENGYKGVFGIDFLYDIRRNKIYPNECNPRFTGSLVLYSLMLLQAKVPPMELFHLMAHLDIASNFNFNTVNQALKTRIPCSHIAFSPRGITSMQLALPAGVYAYDPKAASLDFKRPGISLADIQSEHEFLIIDTVPSLGTNIEQVVPRLFKFIFPRSIARSSYEIDLEAGFLVERFSKALLEAAEENRKVV